MTFRAYFRKGTRTKVGSFSVLLLSLLIVIIEIPILYRNVPNIVIIGLMCLYLLLNLNLFLTLSKNRFGTLLLLGLCVLGEVVYKITGYSSAELHYYFNTFIFFFFILVLVGTFSALNRDQMKWILCTTIIAIVFTLVHNVLLFLQYGSTKYVMLFQTEKYVTNAVGTQFVNALLLFQGAALIWFLRGKTHRTLAMVLAVFSFLFCAVIAQRAIVIVLSIMQLLFLLLFNNERSYKRYAIGFIGILLAGIALLNADAIFSLLTSIIGSERLVRRINQVWAMLSTGDIEGTGGSLRARYRLIMTSLNTFTSSLQHFFFGAGDHRFDNNTIGNHSMVADELARYGVVGTAVMFGMLHRSFHMIRTNFVLRNNSVVKREVNVVFFVAILRAFLGGLTEPEIGIQLFVVLPITVKLICTDDGPLGLLDGLSAVN